MKIRHCLGTFTALSILLLLQCCGQRSEAPIAKGKPHYTITINEQNIRHLSVEAIVPLSGDTISMSPVMAGQLDKGYAEFVQDLKVFDETGAPVSIKPAGKSAWKLEVKTPGMVRLRYTINIDHDKVDWDVSSAFARGYVLENIVFFVGRALFITPTTVDEPIEVEYVLPKNWEVATSLKSLGSKPNQFEAENLGQLLHNGNLAGVLVKNDIQVGNLQVEIAGPAPLRQGIALFHDAMQKFVTTYDSQMGGAPAGKLVVIAALSYSHSPGGEAFPNSISLMLNAVPSAANRSDWGYLLSHEIYHLWNGHSMRAAKQSEVEWFVEGFTQYMSRLTAFKTGFMSQGEFDEEISRATDIYLSLAGNIALTDAGKDKGRNAPFIYNGGMIIAYALDREIKAATKTKGLEHFMREMFERFGKTGKEYQYEDLVKTATDVAGKDMSLFFRDYVSGIKVLKMN